MSIVFYRLIDTIDNVYVINIDSYRFIERFFDIDFYRLPTSGLKPRKNIVVIVSNFLKKPEYPEMRRTYAQ